MSTTQVAAPSDITENKCTALKLLRNIRPQKGEVTCPFPQLALANLAPDFVLEKDTS